LIDHFGNAIQPDYADILKFISSIASFSKSIGCDHLVLTLNLVCFGKPLTLKGMIIDELA
jgi:hypothetical protein